MYNSVLTLFHYQQNPGGSPDIMIDLTPQPERTGYGQDTILRQEDEGGSVFESDTPAPKLTERIPNRSTLQGSSRTRLLLVGIHHSVLNQKQENPNE